MKHTTWLQNRTPAQVLASQTPYKAINKRKPYLGGIQEFGIAVYVKDMNAGKLDARAQIGRFVGYNAESKGYRIYWPGKWSITVERNVVFNENNTRTSENFTINFGDMSDGGRGIKSSNNPQIMLKTLKNPRKLKIKLLTTITSIKNNPKITKTPSNFHLHQKNQMPMIQMNQIHNMRKTRNLKPMAEADMPD